MSTLCEVPVWASTMQQLKTRKEKETCTLPPLPQACQWGDPATTGVQANSHGPSAACGLWSSPVSGHWAAPPGSPAASHFSYASAYPGLIPDTSLHYRETTARPRSHDNIHWQPGTPYRWWICSWPPCLPRGQPDGRLAVVEPNGAAQWQGIKLNWGPQAVVEALVISMQSPSYRISLGTHMSVETDDNRPAVPKCTTEGATLNVYVAVEMNCRYLG